METLKSRLIVLLAMALVACASPDTGYQPGEGNAGGSPPVRQLRRLLLLPPSLQVVESLDNWLGESQECPDPDGVRRRIEAATAARLTDWMDYVVVRPDAGNAELGALLAALRDGLTRDSENRPFAQRMPADQQAIWQRLGKQYAVDGVVVMATRQVGLSPAIFAKMLAISLPTLGVGGIAYVGSVMGAFADAAIYDQDGHLQWWFRGQSGSYWCGDQVEPTVANLFQTLPNALRPGLAPAR